jgi:hypothetical protein
MESRNISFSQFFWRISATHMITYFVIGVIASLVLDYKGSFETPPLSYLMRPVDSAWVAVGPILQILRGLVFSVALWYFKDNFLFVRYGWLKLWGLIVALCTLSTTGAASGSIEGFIYTKIPVASQLAGYFEIIPQTFLFSCLVYYWYENPKKLWNVLSIILVSIIVLLCTMGWLAAQNKI